MIHVFISNFKVSQDSSLNHTIRHIITGSSLLLEVSLQSSTCDKTSFKCAHHTQILCFSADSWCISNTLLGPTGDSFIVHVHDQILTFNELLSLQRFGKKICYHFISWATFDSNFFLFNSVSDKKMSNIDVFCLFSTASFAILFQQNCAFVVLVDDCVTEISSLGF